ncbi:small glutamine-rich tetratricopeptide repeat-containing protein alpha-like isoform X2 [Macrobrachium rosenbergii]|uniref:small glutamine-rich tetratricopeptide repeat-containing protein alpha-like isoform X2 n=1 Tax=Macrobrachium rosenbergii TaxID=79674 RepID=UPI0034D72A38
MWDSCLLQALSSARLAHIRSRFFREEVVKRLVYSMLQFLQSQLEGGAVENGLTEEGVESVEVALQCLETAYGVSLAQNELALPRSLYQMFAEACKASPVQEEVTVTSVPRNEALPSEADKAEAEELKNKGNLLMREELFTEALDCYTKAISKDPRNAVYYCNRAAAHSKLNQHLDAIQDCKRALQIEPQYSKAYGRMGLAYSSLNNHLQAKTCYLKALELEPDNESYKGNLAIAEEKLQSEPNQPATNPFAGIGGLGGLFGGAAGPGGPDLTGLLSNPALMNMATQLMSDPNMQSMMSNLMGGMGGMPGAPPGVVNPTNSVPNNPGPVAPGGGGIEALLNAGRQLAEQMQSQHPELVEQIRQQMNRGPGSGSGDPPGGGSQDSSGQS